jgi:hypothetical protein
MIIFGIINGLDDYTEVITWSNSNIDIINWLDCKIPLAIGVIFQLDDNITIWMITGF